MTNENIYYVYKHIRLDTNAVFYIGKGKGKRALSKRGRNPHWKRIVNKHGYRVEFVDQNITELAAFQLEIAMIAHYGRANLVNMTNGGEGISGLVFTEEHKAKISVSHIGKIKSPEHCANMRAAKMGKAASKEAKAKMSAAHRGKIFSADTRKKLSAALTGKVRSEEHCRKLSIANTGRITSEATRSKLKLLRVKLVVNCKGEVFQSMREAARKFNLNSHAAISLCCSGKIKSAGEYPDGAPVEWSYVK